MTIDNTTTLSITPGQAIPRQFPKHSIVSTRIPTGEWNSFCDAYDQIVVQPYRLAKCAIAISFLLQLIICMTTLTVFDSVPTGNWFLMGPAAFGLVAAAAAAYTFWIYPRVSTSLQSLCEEYNEQWQSHNVVIEYEHNDVHHDLKDHTITIGPLYPDIETAVPTMDSVNEWNPLLLLQRNIMGKLQQSSKST